MAQQAGTQAATPNSQPSWSKGLKRSGLYYEGIVDIVTRFWSSITEALCPPLVPELHRAQSKSFGEENKDSKVTVAIL